MDDQERLIVERTLRLNAIAAREEQEMRSLRLAAATPDAIANRRAWFGGQVRAIHDAYGVRLAALREVTPG